MTEDQMQVIRDLRDAGYAVTVFTPDEMPHSSPEDVEDAMCAAGWNQINFDTPAGESISA